ncbi:LOW QUALITY PROTEIN: potassium channel subfamily K member 2-like [Lampetra planeri]
MKWQAVLTLLGVVVLYLLGGALVFRALERPYEMQQRNHLVITKESFLDKHKCVKPEDMQNLLKCLNLCQTVVEVMGAGVNPISNNTNNTGVSIWDIGDAIFFAGTVLTTIGYGSPSPSTEGGRTFCTVYALFGIPLFGFLLAGVGDQLGSLIGRGIGHVERLFMRWNVSADRIRVISALLFILVGLLLFGGVPIAVFMHIEEWSTLEAVYFVVVTLTTIGFGDFVAGSKPDRIYFDGYKPLVWLWVLVGMAYFAALLCMIGDWLRALSERTRSSMGGITSQAVQWSGLKEHVSATDLLPPKLHKVADALLPFDLLEKGGPTDIDGPQEAGDGGEAGSDSPEATGPRMLGKALGRKCKGKEVKRPWVGTGVEETLVQKGSKPAVKSIELGTLID